VIREALDFVVDLRGELARGGEDQRARGVVRRARAGLAILADQARQHRQHVGRGLAGAGFGAADHVAPGQRVGQHGALHRRGLDVAALLERVEERRLGDQRSKRQGGWFEGRRRAGRRQRDGGSRVARWAARSGAPAPAAARAFVG
jgi:hypothetical protein